MKKFFLSHLIFALFILKAFSSGFDIKTSSVIDQPRIEVLGDYNGSWYVIGFEKPSRLNEPPAYRFFKYADGFPTAKSSKIYPSFGEKTIYLCTAFVNNKISVFYGKCEKRAEVEALSDNRESHKLIPVILCQDYDPNTLKPVGNARVIFKSDNEGFDASGIEVAESDDKSKAAVLIKCYFREQRYKIILADNQKGWVYAKAFDFKPLKQYLSFGELEVSNEGQVLLAAKTRSDIAQSTKSAKQNGYYFFSIDKKGDDVALLNFPLSVKKEKLRGEPVMSLLDDGSIVIAYDFSQNSKSLLTKGISVSKYNDSFKPVAKNEITPNGQLVFLAEQYQYSKKINGLPYLETQQILPLEGGKLMLIAEYHRTFEINDKAGKMEERNYLVTYRLDENLKVSDFHFIPKKQLGTAVDYAFSAQAYRKGNDVFLFHNDDWQSDAEDGMNLQCTRIPGNGAVPETQKIMRTSEDFFTSMKHFFCASNGKLLFTEEKLVDYKSVSREVKLLEITLK